jgi:hypothetical protein
MSESCKFVSFSTDDLFCASFLVDDFAITFVLIATIIAWVLFWDFLAFSIRHRIVTENQSMSEFNFFNQRRFKICYEMWLLIILRMRKSCINDRTIAKIIIIREEFHSKDVMWSILRYNTCSDHSHILIWRWITLIELIWWLQSLSRISIIIKTRNFIIRLTI